MLTEQERLEQGGLGYLAFHASVTWMRKLAEHGASVGFPATEQGDPSSVAPVVWDYGDWMVTFDLKSLGHLLVSLDGAKTWYGMDATFYPPNEMIWDRMVGRLAALRRSSHSFKPVELRPY